MTVTFDFKTPDTIAFDDGAASTSEDFKFGIFDTSQTTLANGNVADVNTGVEIDFTGPISTSGNTPNLALLPLAGFFGEIDNINAPGTDLGIRSANVNGDAVGGTLGGQFLNSNTGFDQNGGDDDVITLVPNTNYVGTISVAYTDATLASFEITVGIANANAADPGVC